MELKRGLYLQSCNLCWKEKYKGALSQHRWFRPFLDASEGSKSLNAGEIPLSTSGSSASCCGSSIFFAAGKFSTTVLVICHQMLVSWVTFLWWSNDGGGEWYSPRKGQSSATYLFPSPFSFPWLNGRVNDLCLMACCLVPPQLITSLLWVIPTPLWNPLPDHIKSGVPFQLGWMGH